jgi:acetyl esterase
VKTQDIVIPTDKVFEPKNRVNDKRINLVGRDDMNGLPPATIVLAQIDPLRFEGETLAEKLKAAGVQVNVQTFPGVTHEFFGMGKIVSEAKHAMDLSIADLKQALKARSKASN